MNNGYVQSLLDNDLYKFSMQNAVCLSYPKAVVKYSFINRDNRDFPEGFGDELKRIIDTFRGLTLSKDGKDFLRRKCYYFNPVYIDFLSGYRYDPSEVSIKQEGSVLEVSANGLWYRTILWEVPLMATISQLYFEMTNQKIKNSKKLIEINKRKAEQFEETGIKFADFGTRRRYSFENHEHVLSILIKEAKTSLVGTSNVYLAMKNNLTPIGTQAHEFFSFMAAKYGFIRANYKALEKWVDVYQGDLGIALTDTFTTDIFLKTFGTKYAKLFDGVRHDSFDPIKFTDKIIRHYRKLKIEPKSKTIVYSDNLDIKKIQKIHNYCKDFYQGAIKDSYGIGTNLTNDIPGIKPLNIVIKMTGYYDNYWIPTVKLSDSPGKHTGDIETINLCKKTLKI